MAKDSYFPVLVHDRMPGIRTADTHCNIGAAVFSNEMSDLALAF
jgi:hypothetical protein